ncbi:hypothetical protein BGZ65_010994 [Modicella reniformis]|uniref:DUF202 domain-containing protein n=1 Tax=Modicella reniformis TaxID=1440133 RepID=A0A9P6J3S4_9FUNG|nr:hypothetical protein BGZ65_010994 [Modicella reniformis]
MVQRSQTSANELVSLSFIPPLSSRSSTSAQRTLVKRKIWSSFPRKKFTFRPKGIERPEKADSFGNKKAKFSNERTMIHWIKTAILLGSLALTLLSFSGNSITPYMGVILLMVCLMTLIYCITVFHVRMEWLDMCRNDVPYYDRVAPTILTILLMVTFAFNVAGKEQFSNDDDDDDDDDDDIGRLPLGLKVDVDELISFICFASGNAFDYGIKVLWPFLKKKGYGPRAPRPSL